MDTKQTSVALIVDDSPDTVHMLIDALEEAGITVLVARTGDKALDVAKRVTPDIILLDANMPGMDGFETARRLKEIDETAQVPIIFITGLADTQNIVKGLEAGAVDYVTKPVTPDELIARISVHVSNARTAQRAQSALHLDGRALIALSDTAELSWQTPEAERTLGALCGSAEAGLSSLCETFRTRLQRFANEEPLTPNHSKIDLGTVEFLYIGQTETNEFLFRVARSGTPGDTVFLKGRFSLTDREADVLQWVTKGKTNKDIAEILSVSPRTVNKHLEAIFIKLGVENRTAAATAVVSAMAEN